MEEERSPYGEYPQSATVQLRERLSADVADHVHGLVRQKVEPGLREGQEVVRLLFRLQ